MKEVCEKTGLTDRAVRLYIDSGLLQPTEERNYNGRKSIRFSDEDVEILKAVATLRMAEFSISEIGDMQRSPDRIYAVLQEHKQKIAREIESKSRILHTLEQNDCTTVQDYSRLAELLRGSASSNMIPKEDSMMRFKDFQGMIRNRIPSVVAFALLVLGVVTLIPLLIQTAFAEVELLGKGGIGYVYTFTWNRFFQYFPLFAVWLMMSAAAVMMLFHIAKGKRWLSATGAAFCIFSVIILLVLPSEMRDHLNKFEFYAYRFSFLWNILGGTTHAVDIFIQTLKFIPIVLSAILALISSFCNSRIRQ